MIYAMEKPDQNTAITNEKSCLKNMIKVSCFFYVKTLLYLTFVENSKNPAKYISRSLNLAKLKNYTCL